MGIIGAELLPTLKQDKSVFDQLVIIPKLGLFFAFVEDDNVQTEFAEFIGD